MIEQLDIDLWDENRAILPRLYTSLSLPRISEAIDFNDF